MTRTLVLFGLLIPTLASAGKKDAPPDADHANHYKAADFGAGDVKLAVKDAWARDGEAKAKVTVQNDTEDYLLYKTGESLFNSGGADYAVKTGLKGSMVLVLPKESGSRVLSTAGTGLHNDALTIVPKGLYIVPKNAPVIATPDFRLPLERSDVKAGSFECTVPKKIKQETDETEVKFKCRYEGSAIGIVDPKQIQVKLEDGQMFANDDRNMKPQILLPGDEFKMGAAFHVSAKIVDMQFATMHIVFNDTFREGQARPFDAKPITLELDPGLTAEKND